MLQQQCTWSGPKASLLVPKYQGQQKQGTVLQESTAKAYSKDLINNMLFI